MKYSEFHRIIRSNGWQYVRSSGSHYFYEKTIISGNKTIILKSPPIPFHGADEMPKGIAIKITRQMELK